MPADEFTKAKFLGLATASVVTLGICAYFYLKKQRQDSTKWMKIGRVSEIFVYPVKSIRGASVNNALARPAGLKLQHLQDRSFMVFNEVSKKRLSPFEAPQFELITVGAVPTDEGKMKLVVEGKKDMEIDLDKVLREHKVVYAKIMPTDAAEIETLDCGDAVGKWITEFVNATLPEAKRASFRLLYHDADTMQNWRTFNRLVPENSLNFFKNRTDRSTLAKTTPYMICNQSTLNEINKKLRSEGKEQVSVRNFRPNIVVSGSKAFDEDRWDQIKIGDRAAFAYLIDCLRCPVTTIDPRTGHKDKAQEPLNTLKRFRVAPKPLLEAVGLGKSGKPRFGLLCGLDMEGGVRVGDPVYVRYKRRE